MRLCAWLLCSSFALPARAEPSYWTRLLAPDEVRALRLVREGRAQLSPAEALGPAAGLPRELAAQRKLALDSALVRFTLARQLAPNSTAAALAQAQVLADVDPRAAIRELEQLRARAPLYEAEQVASLLGALHARHGEYAQARAELQRALAMHCSDGPPAALLIALAQVVMFQDDLPRALALYDAALSDPSQRVPALWGRAVALDRIGEHALALSTAQRALAEDRGATLQQMSFVPPFERSYYQGLAALAQGQPAQALESFTQYLAANQGPFLEDAREHIAALPRLDTK